MSIAVKSNLMSALQAFSLGGGWPRKAPRMPQDGRSPGGFIWGGRGINPCYPTGVFRIWGGRMSQNRSTGILARNSGIPAVFAKTPGSLLMALLYMPKIWRTFERLLSCVRTSVGGMGVRVIRATGSGRVVASRKQAT